MADKSNFDIELRIEGSNLTNFKTIKYDGMITDVNDYVRMGKDREPQFVHNYAIYYNKYNPKAPADDRMTESPYNNNLFHMAQEVLVTLKIPDERINNITLHFISEKGEPEYFQSKVNGLSIGDVKKLIAEKMKKVVNGCDFESEGVDFNNLYPSGEMTKLAVPVQATLDSATKLK